MNSEKVKIIKFLSECLKGDLAVITALYTETESLDETLPNQVKGDILIQILQAAFLIHTVDHLEETFRGTRDKIIPFHLLKGSIQLALLVSAVEAVGTPSEYLNFNQWMNKEFFPREREEDNFYSKKKINKAWNEYNENYGSTKSFRDVILNSELSTLLTEFLFSGAIILFEEENKTPYPYERVQLGDIKNPRSLASRGRSLHYKEIEYIFVQDASEYVIIEKKGRKRKKISDIDEIKDFWIFIKDLRNFSDIQLKKDKLEKYLKPKLNYLYHLRSGYYHTGELPLSKDIDHIAQEPWKYGGKTYRPLIEKSMISLFEEISRKVIISSWKQKLKSLTKQRE